MPETTVRPNPRWRPAVMQAKEILNAVAGLQQEFGKEYLGRLVDYWPAFCGSRAWANFVKVVLFAFERKCSGYGGLDAI